MEYPPKCSWWNRKIWKNEDLEGGYFPYFPYFGGSRYGKYPPKNPRKYRNHQIWGISHLQIHHDTPILKPRSSRYTICIGPSPTTWCHVEPLGPTTANPLFRFMVRERLVVDWLGFGQHRVSKKLCILWKIHVPSGKLTELWTITIFNG